MKPLIIDPESLHTQNVQIVITSSIFDVLNEDPKAL